MEAVVELNSMRTQIIRMVCDESNEQVLNKVEKFLSGQGLLYRQLPCCYSHEELRQRVRKATDSIRDGQGYTLEEVKSLHSCLV